MLGNTEPEASGAGEIVPGAEFYDYEDKYVTDGAQLLIPAPLTPEQTAEVRALAVRVFEVLRCDGLARVDFFFEEGGRGFLCNEANTMPGFTPISMYPKLWQAAGVTYAELIDRLVDLAIERHGPPPPQHRPLNRAAVSAARSARAQERPQLGAEAAQRGRRRRPADAAQRLRLGGDAGDGAVGERGDEARIAAAQAAGVHLGAEEGDGAVRSAGRRAARSRSACGPGSRLSSRTSPSRAGRRTARRNAARTTASTRASGSSGAAADRGVDDDGDLGRRRLEDGVDELLLAGEPVQDGLLADADLGGDLVERHGIDAAGPEAVERRRRGCGHGCPSRRVATPDCLRTR